MARVTLTLLGKPGCHLCDDARAVIDDVITEHPNVDLVEVNILDDAALFEDYQSLIPVVRVNEKTVATWRVDAESLRAAIIEESA